MRLAALLILLPTLFVLEGCPRPLPMPAEQIINTSRITGVIDQNIAKRHRAAGRFKARAAGLKRLFGTLDLTFALQQPSSIYLSIPSFFGMPARLVTSDGQHNYILDMSGTDPLYLVEPHDAGSLQRWIGLPITPREFVFGLLGIVDLQNAMIIDTRLNRSTGTYTLRLRYKNGRECLAEFNFENDDLVSQSSYRNDDKIYSVAYSDFRDGPAGRFPWHIDVAAKGAQGSVKLTLDGDDLRFPAEPYEIDTFQIEEP